jgi:hypothetical protein
MQDPIRVNRYGFEVWENPRSDAVRKEECLCAHCRFMGSTCPVRTDTEDREAPVCAQLFEICLTTGMAMCITRCPKWELK